MDMMKIFVKMGESGSAMSLRNALIFSMLRGGVNSYFSASYSALAILYTDIISRFGFFSGAAFFING